MPTRRLPFLVLLVCLGACGSDVDDRPASFAYISATILVPNCATSGCHAKLPSAGGVRLDDKVDAYTSLVQGMFVDPGNPDRSQLIHLLNGDNVWRMPPDQPLPNADIELIQRWILEGAQDN